MLVIMALAFGAWVLQARYKERREAIQRADTKDIPRRLGDEIHKHLSECCFRYDQVETVGQHSASSPN